MRYLIKTFIIIAVFISACTKTTTVQQNHELRISGSDTELQLVQQLSSAYQNSNKKADAFKVEGGGSGKGIEDLIEEKSIMANASRAMTGSEKEQLKSKQISIEEHILATDAVSIVTDPQIGVDSLSTIDLSNIFTGRVKNWKKLGGKDLPITIFGRDKNSGTRFYLKNRFARYHGFGSNHKACASNEAIIERVKSNKGAIGYVGIGYIMKSYGTPIESVWTMPIYVEGGNASSPYEMLAISRGDYELTRPLYQFYRTDNAAIKEFLNFEQSQEGQKLIRDSGFYNH
ncbi:MAG: phosphate ABC transporter substrate-binding protein [Bacteroidota bacterium]